MLVSINVTLRTKSVFHVDKENSGILYKEKLLIELIPLHGNLCQSHTGRTRRRFCVALKNLKIIASIIQIKEKCI